MPVIRMEGHSSGLRSWVIWLLPIALFAETTALFQHPPGILASSWFCRLMKSFLTLEFEDLLFLLSRSCVFPSVPLLLVRETPLPQQGPPEEAVQRDLRAALSLVSSCPSWHLLAHHLLHLSPSHYCTIRT